MLKEMEILTTEGQEISTRWLGVLVLLSFSWVTMGTSLNPSEPGSSTRKWDLEQQQ